MAIYVNQVGYMTNGKKTAVLTAGKTVCLINAETDQIVWSSEVPTALFDQSSGDKTACVDFSDIKTEGSYYLKNDTGEKSFSFKISNEPYRRIRNDALKAFYYQRCGTKLKEEYAGIFQHECCHTKPVTELENRNVLKNVNGGWHDAGDYGRYSTAASVALGHLLYAFILYPEQWNDMISIPESGNGVPDLLNECRYELDWLMKMQREDGGVYHKLTSFCHSDMIMPEEDTADFYLFTVSTLATADFAAVMALASRVYQNYDKEFSANILHAAKSAWNWLEQHEEFIFISNPQGCNTGEYDDKFDEDERIWAAAELFVTTADKKYEQSMLLLLERQGKLVKANGKYPHDEEPVAFGWKEVTGFAGMAILFDSKQQAKEETRRIFMDTFVNNSNKATAVVEASGYKVALKPDEYVWGSNMVVEDKGVLLALTARLTGKSEYSSAAQSQLDYLLGINAVNYSYLTGFGEHAFSHPHNRPTVALGDQKVMPGWVSGGPNGHPVDEVGMKIFGTNTPPMKCYLDRWECYSLNEIAIYWNSLFVLLVACIIDK